MGSKEEDVPSEPKQKAVFVEDMNEDELACAVSCLSSLSLLVYFYHFYQNVLIFFYSLMFHLG